MTTGKVYLSNYYFCTISLNLIFVEINASLLHFTTDLCVCVHVCMYVCVCETGKEEGNPVSTSEMSKKNQCLWNVLHERKLLKDDSILQLFLNKGCIFRVFFLFSGSVQLFFLSVFYSIEPSGDEEDCDLTFFFLFPSLSKTVYKFRLFSYKNLKIYEKILNSKAFYWEQRILFSMVTCASCS